MPVTIKPAPHGAKAYPISSSYVKPAANATELFTRTCVQEAKKMKEIKMIQSSFEKLSSEDKVLSSSNGFLNGAIDAYNNHYKLIIRPEDVWFSILTQLNAYINANAETLRHLFVDHEGQKELKIIDLSDINGKAMFGVDWGKFSFKMTKMIAENIKDPSFREWILPTFTTTTKTDQAVASILMMSSMQKYFTYAYAIACGLPSVTLLGQREDWEKLEKKLERLPTFGEETAEWYTLLKPIMARFVRSFDAPDSEETKDFWQKIAHYFSGGSGPTYLSGWITAFCFWNEDGKPFPRPKDWTTKAGPAQHSNRSALNLELDGAHYHHIESTDVPRGFASVPVKLLTEVTEIPSIMVAGSVGVRISSSGELLHEKDETGFDTVQPESGWWMYEKGVEKTKEEEEEEELERYRSLAAKWKKDRERVLAQ